MRYGSNGYLASKISNFFIFKRHCCISIVNPLRIKRFSQMHLRRNKIDKADAQIICKFGQEQNLNLWKPAPQELEQAKDIVQKIEQYIEFRAGLKNKNDGLNPTCKYHIKL